MCETGCVCVFVCDLYKRLQLEKQNSFYCPPRSSHKTWFLQRHRCMVRHEKQSRLRLQLIWSCICWTQGDEARRSPSIYRKTDTPLIHMPPLYTKHRHTNNIHIYTHTHTNTKCVPVIMSKISTKCSVISVHIIICRTAEKMAMFRMM